MNQNNLNENNKASALSIAIVTNTPAPYRIPIYQILAQKLGVDQFNVIYCTTREANRAWDLNQSDFNLTYLKENTFVWQGRYIHFNWGVLKQLRQLNPNVVITTGFNPTFLLAFAYAIFYKKKHIPMTDGTLASEQMFTWVHRFVRRVVYRFSSAFIGASLGSFMLYNRYGIGDKRMFKSHLCANNKAFEPVDLNNRPFDFMFSGRFSAEKNPIFALNVAYGVAKLLKRKVTMFLLGSGALLAQAQAHALTLEPHVEAVFSGFVQQQQLPPLYCSAKVFLFPTSWDPWGVVANEACAAGQAVIVSPHAGVANDLVMHAQNGYVLPLNLNVWVQHAADLLSNAELLKQFSNSSLLNVQAYTYEAAANGIMEAVCSQDTVMS